MPHSTQSLQFQIQTVFGISFISERHCDYLAPAGYHDCINHITATSAQNAHAIIHQFALQSPLNPQSSYPTSHQIDFIETLRQLSIYRLCTTHATPIGITTITLTWLDRAANLPGLFRFTPQLTKFRPELHRLLPLLARRYEPNFWHWMLPTWIYTLDMISQRPDGLEYFKFMAETPDIYIHDTVDDHISNLINNFYEDIMTYLEPTTVPVSRTRVELRTRPYEDDNDDFSSSTRPFPRRVAPPVPPRSPLRIDLTYQDGDGRKPNRSPPPRLGSPDAGPNEDCPICCEPVSRADRAIACIVCRKVFHLECMQQWQRSQRDSVGRDVTCPCCRVRWDDA